MRTAPASRRVSYPQRCSLQSMHMGEGPPPPDSLGWLWVVVGVSWRLRPEPGALQDSALVTCQLGAVMAP